MKSSGVINPYEHNGYVALEDKVNVLLFLAKLSDTIADLKKDKIRTIFTDEIQGICLSTVHKIKGLEANRVFIIHFEFITNASTKILADYTRKILNMLQLQKSRLELIYDRNWSDEE